MPATAAKSQLAVNPSTRKDLLQRRIDTDAARYDQICRDALAMTDENQVAPVLKKTEAYVCGCGHNPHLHTAWPHRQYTVSGQSYWMRSCAGTIAGAPCRCDLYQSPWPAAPNTRKRNGRIIKNPTTSPERKTRS